MCWGKKKNNQNLFPFFISSLILSIALSQSLSFPSPYDLQRHSLLPLGPLFPNLFAIFLFPHICLWFSLTFPIFIFFYLPPVISFNPPLLCLLQWKANATDQHQRVLLFYDEGDTCTPVTSKLLMHYITDISAKVTPKYILPFLTLGFFFSLFFFLLLPHTQI